MGEIAILSGVIFLALFFGNISYGFNPDTEGFIKEWLIAGVFPNEGKWPICKGYFKDFLENEGGEKNIEPHPRMFHKSIFISSRMPPIQVQIQPGVSKTLGWEIKEELKFDASWKPHSFKIKKCDFKELKFPIEEYCIAYAVCYVEMKEKKKLKLKIGSDDGCKIWLNHKFIGEVHEHRAAKIDANVYEVELEKGINILLIKLEQDWAGWELYARFTEMDDKPFTDYIIHLTHPEHCAINKTTKPEKVNLIDKDIVGYLLWQGKDETMLFPGEITGVLELASANKINADLSIEILNEKKEKIYSKKEKLELSPDISKKISLIVNFPSSGNYTFNAKITKNRNIIGNLNKILKVYNPQTLFEDYLKLKEESGDLKNKILESEESIKNLEYVIKTKEKMIEERNKKIDSLFEEIIKFKEGK